MNNENTTVKIKIEAKGSMTFHKNPKEARLSRDPVSRKINAATTRAMRKRAGLTVCGGANAVVSGTSMLGLGIGENFPMNLENAAAVGWVRTCDGTID